MKTLITFMFITTVMLIYSCGGTNESTASSTDSTSGKDVKTASENTKTSALSGTYNASGSITFTVDGTNYSCSISKLIAAPTSLTIQTSSKDVRTNGSITVVCYTAASAITTGTYTAPSTTTISSVTYVDKNVMPFSAVVGVAGSSCSLTLSALTTTSVQGTFTATAISALGKKSLNITNGVINCTIGSK